MASQDREKGKTVQSGTDLDLPYRSVNPISSGGSGSTRGSNSYTSKTGSRNGHTNASKPNGSTAGKKGANNIGTKTARSNGVGTSKTAMSSTDSNRNTEDSSYRTEINGVLIIIIGIIIGIFCYGGSGGFLAKIAPFFFGLFGIGAYLIPIICIALGIYRILNNGELSKKTIAYIFVVLLSFMTIIHISAFSELLGAMNIFKFIAESYTGGCDRTGGGVICGIIAKFLTALIGDTGSYVLLIGIIIIMLLLITKFSIRNLNNSFKTWKQEKDAEYEDELGSETKKRTKHSLKGMEHKSNAKRSNIESDANVLFNEEDIIEHSGKPLTVGDYTGGLASDSIEIKRNNEKQAARTGSIKKPSQHSSKKNKFANSDDLELFPLTGAIKTERKRYGRPQVIDPVVCFDGQAEKNKRNKFNNIEEAPSAYGDVGMENKVFNSDPSAVESLDADPFNVDSINDASFKPDSMNGDSFLPDVESDIIDDCGSLDAINAQLNNMEDIDAYPKADNTTNSLKESNPSKKIDGAVDTESSGGEIKIKSEVPADVAEYQRPPFALLRRPDPASAVASESPEEKARILIETLNSFNISAKVINFSVGPTITRFELQPAQGIRVNKITTLSNDIALALAAPRVRIEAPIPGKAAIGIEIPNKDVAPVLLREVLETREYNAAKSPLAIALGKDIAGKVLLADLEKMPHMLIAGQTGSGKSVCINGIILSLIYKSSPKDVRMILVDPKVVELGIFSAIPHLFCPVVTEPKKAAGALKWAVREMEERYAKMGKINARDIYRYNAMQNNEDDKWPRLVIVIDELADLMMVASKDVEESICRIAQLGRACGIHLVVATQRPSVDVITGLIKANIPSRIAFAVSNATDSRVILDSGGAEKLLGRGDMLFHANGASKPTRAQGAFVTDEEVEAVMDFFTQNRTDATEFNESVLSEINVSAITHNQGNGKQEDDLLPDAVRIIIESGTASISMIQRRLRVGYARAARLIDIMEQKKYVSASDGSKPRKVLIDATEYNRVFGGTIQIPDNQN